MPHCRTAFACHHHPTRPLTYIPYPPLAHLCTLYTHRRVSGPLSPTVPGYGLADQRRAIAEAPNGGPWEFAEGKFPGRCWCATSHSSDLYSYWHKCRSLLDVSLDFIYAWYCLYDAETTYQRPLSWVFLFYGSTCCVSCFHLYISTFRPIDTFCRIITYYTQPDRHYRGTEPPTRHIFVRKTGIFVFDVAATRPSMPTRTDISSHYTWNENNGEW